MYLRKLLSRGGQMAYKNELLSLPKTEEVIEELLVANKGLMYKQLYKFHLVNDQDAYSHALMALHRAIMTYDASKGAAFSNYASVCVFNGLGCYVRGLKSGIEEVSYDVMIGEDVSFLSTMESKDTADGRYMTYKNIVGIYKILNESLAKLPKLNKLVVSLWIDSEFMLNQSELAEATQCSQSYVSRILTDFKKIVKNKLREECT
jgi:DNA-directed RNA polymerase specialized sigma subunit